MSHARGWDLARLAEATTEGRRGEGEQTAGNFHHVARDRDAS